jgi:6-phosphogluconolactonase/glucosamine-6-phosphate isomerase/deaminase
MKITTIPELEKLRDKFASDVAQTVNQKLTEGEVILFLSGGSVISTYNLLAERLDSELVSNLSLVMADDRMFEPNSMSCGLTTLNTNINANQIILETKLIDFVEANSGSFLRFDSQLSPKEATEKFENQLGSKLESANSKIGIFGIGADGHTAGIKPIFNKSEFSEKFEDSRKLVTFFEANDYPFRATTSIEMIKNIDQYFIYSCGSKKEDILTKLKQTDTTDKNYTLHEFPAQIFANTDAKIYTDQQIS